jgi:hypothetical protein
VGERVAADDGLVWLDGESGQVADQARGRGQVLGLDAAREIGELRRARAEGHHDLLERSVAGALAKAVDRDLDLARAGLHGGERVRGRQSEVVVAVDRDRGLAPQERHRPTYERGELRRDRVSDRVRDVDRRRAGLDDGLVDLEQELRIRARRVLGAELDLDIAPELLAAIGDPADRLSECRLAIDPELVLEVDVAGRDEHVEMRPLGDLDRLDGALRVAVAAARERGDRDPALRLAGDPVDGLEVAVRGGREAGLDHVHLQAHQLAGDLELLGRGETGAGRLLAVAEGRVEDANAVRRGERPGGLRTGAWRSGHQASKVRSELGCVRVAGWPSPEDAAAAPLTIACASPALITTGSRNCICARSSAPTCSIW